jgi:catechol 2,3-dioxygenase-like lactoylglutathione lyase family enzyme
MKRMHIGMKVDDIGVAVDFYSKLFGESPSLQRDDYAKWMLDDPFVNFSVDLHGDGPVGSAHYGIQFATDDDLGQARTDIDEAGLERADQDDLICGYQLQDKSWVSDPHGVAWEMFRTHGLAGDGEAYGCEDMP